MVENYIEQKFEAVDSNLMHATIFVGGAVESTLEKIGKIIKPADQMKIDISIEEIFINVAHYAYSNAKEGTDKYVKIGVGEVDGNILLSFVDHGIPYNPLEKDDPDITLSAEERNIGGLGIFMVKNYMKEMSYEYKNEENCLSMIFEVK